MKFLKYTKKQRVLAQICGVLFGVQTVTETSLLIMLPMSVTLHGRIQLCVIMTGIFYLALSVISLFPRFLCGSSGAGGGLADRLPQNLRTFSLWAKLILMLIFAAAAIIGALLA